MRAVAAVLVLALCACNAPGPGFTGVAAGIDDAMEPPRRPAADPSTVTIAFQPVPGIPGNVGDELLRSLWEASEREGLTVVKRPGGRATFFVDANVAGVSDDTNGLVFYVFNVRDVTGRRLYRIYGQEATGSTGGDPFAGTTEQDLDLIARRAVVQLKAWLNADT